MPFRLGWPEWIGILLLVIILFGPGRIGKVFSELGKSVRSFRDGLKGDDEEPRDETGNDEPKP
jgi:sec-independent protein translocase protein TatA